MIYRSSAPGSLMLLGEYAVLQGGFALIASVNQRMTVELLPRSDSTLLIKSQLGRYESQISQLEVRAPFQFVLTLIKKYITQLPSGFELSIHSDFSDKIGFASSAAITVSLLRALHAWLDIKASDSDMILEARAIVREVQGQGSGADIAACVLGGIVAYRAEPFSAEKIAYDYPLTAIYSGSKTKTADAILYVNKHFSDNTQQLNNIMNAIDRCAQSGIQAAKEKDHDMLGKIMNEQQCLMEALTVSTPRLDELIHMLRSYPNILGAKISGSGLGDCAIGLGDADVSRNKLNNLSPYHLKTSSRGVSCEKI